MIRTTVAVLGLAFLATAANAAEISVPTAGRSPTEVRVAITDAAFKACKLAYADDVLAVYKRDSCVRDSVEAALAKTASETAMNTAHGAQIVSR